MRLSMCFEAEETAYAWLFWDLLGAATKEDAKAAARVEQPPAAALRH
jgi:hypothetical protein